MEQQPEHNLAEIAQQLAALAAVAKELSEQPMFVFEPPANSNELVAGEEAKPSSAASAQPPA